MNSSATLTGCNDIIKRLREAIAEHPLSPIHGYAEDIAALLDRLDKAERENERMRERLEKLERVASSGTVQNWLALPDETKALTFALLCEESSRRKLAEDENDRLRADAERLDSGLIRLVDRDEFGESVATVYSQVDLRAAIDAARGEK